MKHQMKRIFAGLLSAAILLPTTVSFTEPLSCSASELLGETSFDYKIIPWMPVESSPAKQDFDISDGAAHMTILNPKGQSLSVWDLKFRYRGLDFIEGHTYNVSCKIKARRAGMQVSSFIGTSDGYERYFVLDGDTGDMHMGPDMDGKWGCCVELSDEYQEFSGVFKPKRDIEGAVWEFWYAYDTNGYGGNAQEGDEIWFDDMSIIDMGRTDPMPVQSCGYTARQYSGLDQNYISVNQLGYFPGLAKYATLGNNKGDFTNDAERITLSGSYDYEIVNDDTEEVVYTGKTGKAFADRDSGDTVCKIDFTDFDDYGKYYIRIKGKKWRSFPFTIGYSIYRQGGHELLNNALNYFYQSRAGADIEEKYITSGNAQALAHAKNRDDSLGVVQEVWHNTPMLQADDADIHGSSRIDVGGGWYTGSGFDKNMTEAGCALWTLQNLYERCDLFMDGEQLFEQNPETEGIPETGNRCPDILDECRYELDFMSKMKVQPDEPTWGEYAGLYYHRAQGVGFVPNPPDYELEYQAKYAVYPPTFAATLSYAACAAQGARLWLQYDSDYAAALLKSAKEAYQAYLTHYYEADFGGTVHPDGYISFNEETNEKSLYAPRFQGRSKLTDSDMYVKDDAYWAACEIYLSSYIFDGFDEENDQKADMAFYLKELSSYSNAFQVTARVNCYTTNAAGESTYSMFSSSNMASAGSLSLEIFSFLLTEPQEEKLQKSILDVADHYILTTEKQGYGTPYLYDGPGYNDPGNLSPNIICYGYEYGSNAYVLNNMIAMAYAYDVTYEERYLNGVTAGMDYLLGNNPLAYSFITGYGNYHAVNPAGRYWRSETDASLPQAPDGVLVSGPNAGLQDSYVRALGLEPGSPDMPSQRCYADSAESWSTNSASLSGNASLAWIASFMERYVRDTNGRGDVNGDGTFDIKDMKLLQKWLLTKPEITLTEWRAADFNGDKKLTATDLSLMKKHYLDLNVYSRVVYPQKTSQYTTRLYVISDGLKLYSGPSEYRDVFTTIPKNATILEMGYNDNDENWIFTEYCGIKGWVKTVAADGTPTVEYLAAPDKPVIYLYPEQETDVHVELELTESELYTTYPKYNNGWDVTASPDGTLLNKADGSRHRYLFWDAVNCRTRFDFSKGFCVAGSDTEQFLKEKLTYMGLTEEEMNEFIVYWLPRTEHNAYNLIAFQTEAYTNSAKLTVTPAPDSECRIFMAYVPLDEAVEIEPQQLETFERKGFAVVEWGGVEIRS